MIIAQITDLHVVAKDRLCYRRVPTNAQLAEAVAHLNRLEPRPDVVIASGDLTDHGREEEYAMLREILAPLVVPVFLIPGNHDRREALRKVFADQPYLSAPDQPFIHYTVEEYPIRLVALDTTVPGSHHGMLCADRLRWLDETLNAKPNQPTLIFMHHPPFRTGVRWMDASGLHGGRAMEAIVSRHRQVVRVACGHIHRPIHVAWAGTIASVAPSTCHQVTLNMSDREALDFIMEPRALQLHVLDSGYGLVSHLSYVPCNYEHVPILGSLPAETVAELLARERGAYEELRREEYERPR
jgi:3',5'-cyclic-AMP phosphodiesterase